MCTRQDCIDKLTQAAPYIKAEFEVKSLCLFGSMARGDNNEESDVDLCVDMPPKAIKVLALKNFLQKTLGASVDLIRRHKNLRPLFLSKIEEDAIYVIR
ncbi:nucleotidyltransferase domain-containing protein [uncultured Muribaculum sp.]|jgi:putative toxin-antitoxin system, toxin component|uniref:nucleotidyltransferase family protein n=2 Tax=uncultured Muribaculum sp. TaxID=1918613 RepID=UPI0025B1D2D8|nr:nucleotidyltransferase domain-containing protein [uncultured Muribaculum sp.]